MKSLGKSCEVLRVVAGGGPAGVREMARSVGLPRSTTHRLLRALEQQGLIQRAGTSDGWILGPLVRELAGGSAWQQHLIRLVRPWMGDLRGQCGETIGLHVLERGHRVTIDQVESASGLMFRALGVPMPLHAGATSRVLLASLPDAEIAACLSRARTVFTPHTPRDPRQVMAEVRRIRREGYAVSFEEINPGISSVAMPIALDGGHAAALSVAGPRSRLTPARLREIRPMLAATVQGIERALRAGADTAALRRRRGVPFSASR